MSSIYTLGIDVGSTASKCIILKDGSEIVAKSLIDVGAGTSGPKRAIDAVLENAGMAKEDMGLYPGDRLWPQLLNGSCRQTDERAFLPCERRVFPVPRRPYGN